MRLRWPGSGIVVYSDINLHQFVHITTTIIITTTTTTMR